MNKIKFFILSTIFVLPGHVFWPLPASSKEIPSYHQVALEIPFEGGGMIMYSRMWMLNRYLEAGFTLGGGVIEREFEASHSGRSDLKAKTTSLVLPFFGPRVTAIYHVIGISVGYGVFYSDTDFEVEVPGTGRFSGQKKSGGTGFYSPLLEISFLDSKRGAVYGIGLGGFYGMSFPDLTASRGGERITSQESPIDTLTVHVSVAFGHKSGRQAQERDDW